MTVAVPGGPGRGGRAAARAGGEVRWRGPSVQRGPLVVEVQHRRVVARPAAVQRGHHHHHDEARPARAALTTGGWVGEGAPWCVRVARLPAPARWPRLASPAPAPRGTSAWRTPCPHPAPCRRSPAGPRPRTPVGGSKGVRRWVVRPREEACDYVQPPPPNMNPRHSGRKQKNVVCTEQHFTRNGNFGGNVHFGGELRGAEKKFDPQLAFDYV